MSDEDNSSQVTMKLIEMKAGQPAKEFIVHEGNNLIGRWDPDSGSFPDIDLEPADPEAKVSRKHAIIDRDGAEAEIEDLNSLNGTFLNRGSRLRAGIREPLKHGDELVIGKTFLLVEISES